MSITDNFAQPAETVVPAGAACPARRCPVPLNPLDIGLFTKISANGSIRRVFYVFL
jgi:hypothetical protein